MIPSLIIVSGPPCSGKSTLARRLGLDLSLPAAGKDLFKEILFDTLGARDHAWSMELGRAAIEMLYAFAETNIAAGVSCVIESTFRRDLDSPRLAAMRERHAFLPIRIDCRADGAVLIERVRRRIESGERHAGHCDILDDGTEMMLRRTEPPAIDGPLIEVDTTNFDAAGYKALGEAVKTHMRRG